MWFCDVPGTSSGTDFTVELLANGGRPVFVGSCVELLFDYKLQTGNLVTDLVPYLGVAAHIVVAHESMDADTLIHIHGMAANESQGMHESQFRDDCLRDMMVSWVHSHAAC